MNLDSAELLLFAGRAAILVVAFAAFAFAFVRWRRAARADTQRLADELDRALLELRAITGHVQALAASFDEMKERLAAQATQAAASANGGAPRGYDVAIRLARSGATPDELIATSGVTREEARLLTRLHRRTDDNNTNTREFRATA